MDNFKLELHYSISMTTRPKRDKEVDGVDYYFVSNEEFQRNIDNNNFLEWEEFVGNRYGTPKDKVEELRNKGKHVLLEIEVNGASEVFSKVNDDRVISFFLMPPNLKSSVKCEKSILSTGSPLEKGERYESIRLEKEGVILPKDPLYPGPLL